MPLLRQIGMYAPAEERERSSSFSLQARCVMALYARLLGKLQNESYRAINLHCVRAYTEENWLNLDGVLVVEVIACVDEFFALESPLEKKWWAFERLRQGIGLTIKKLNWSESPFAEAFREAERANLENIWTWKKPVKSPDKNHVARVVCHHDTGACHIRLIVSDKHGKEVTNKLLVSDLPDELCFSTHLGALEWISSHEVALIPQHGDAKKIVRID